MSATNLGGGLFRIKAEVENKGFLPTSTAQGQVSRSVRATLVQLSVDAKDIVSGDAQTNNIPILAGSGRRQSYQWIVKGKTRLHGHAESRGPEGRDRHSDYYAEVVDINIF